MMQFVYALSLNVLVDSAWSSKSSSTLAMMEITDDEPTVNKLIIDITREANGTVK